MLSPLGTPLQLVQSLLTQFSAQMLPPDHKPKSSLWSANSLINFPLFFFSLPGNELILYIFTLFLSVLVDEYRGLSVFPDLNLNSEIKLQKNEQLGSITCTFCMANPRGTPASPMTTLKSDSGAQISIPPLVN